MSKTYMDKLRWIQRRYWHRKELYDNLSPIDKEKVDRWYRQSPSWWNLLFHTKPRRAKVRGLIKKVSLQPDREVIWPLDRKPHKYYW